MSNNQEKGGSFSHGFLLGVIIGGAVVFFLGTKKGRRLLGNITEEGLSGVADLEEFIGEDLEEPMAKQKSSSVDKQVGQENLDEESKVPNGIHSSEESRKSPVLHKRFFKGISRRS